MKKIINIILIILILTIGLFSLIGCNSNKQTSDTKEKIKNEVKEVSPEDVILNVTDLKEGKVVYNKNNVVITITKIAKFNTNYEVFCSVNNSNDYPISIYGIIEGNNGNAVRINDILIDNTGDSNTFSLNRQYFEIGKTDPCTLINIKKSDCANLGISNINKISFGVKITILDGDNTELEADIITLE